jgi:hypothetical protein
MRLVLLAAVGFWLASVAVNPTAQTPTKDASAVFAEGKISGKEYKNEYFGLTLTTVDAQFTEEGFVSPRGTRARLIDAEANAKNWEDRYSISMLADALSANPLVRSPAQYVRSVRHQFEQREGMVTVQEETPIEISGLQFVGAALKVTQEGRTHYQGIYTTILNGYILSLQVEASAPERLNQIVLSMVKFKSSPN